MHRVIKFNQKAWLKSYIDTNTVLRKNSKNDFETDFFKLINNVFFAKTMENVRKHRDIKLAGTKARKNYLVSEPNYFFFGKSISHLNYLFFLENLLAIEMERPWILMNKPVYLGLPILEISKIAMYKFPYDYTKLKYGAQIKIMLHP